MRRAYPPEIVDQVIQYLCAQSLIDDRAFARLWTDSRLRNKPRSAYMVKRELLGKGIDSEIADNAVSDVDDSDAAYRAASTYAPRLRNADYDAFHRRLYGYLARRGFSASVSRRVVSRFWLARSQDAFDGAES